MQPELVFDLIREDARQAAFDADRVPGAREVAMRDDRSSPLRPGLTLGLVSVAHAAIHAQSALLPLVYAIVIVEFGLSEREHGADIYTTDMVLTPDGGGGFRATGGKYYIGNGNVSRMVSVFGRRSDVDGPDGYVFFAADSQHENYRLVKNIVQAQMFVAEFRLENYPVGPQDVLHTGQAAFAAALNTVNGVIGRSWLRSTKVPKRPPCTQTEFPAAPTARAPARAGSSPRVPVMADRQFGEEGARLPQGVTLTPGRSLAVDVGVDAADVVDRAPEAAEVHGDHMVDRERLAVDREQLVDARRHLRLGLGDGEFDAIFARGEEAASSDRRPDVAALVSLASELRLLPRENFKLNLKEALIRSAHMTTTGTETAAQAHDALTSRKCRRLFGA